MRSVERRTGRALAFLVLAASLALTSNLALAGEVATAEVRFEVTLSGAVPADDAFYLARACEATPCFVESIHTICTGDEVLRADWGYPVCDARTYVYVTPPIPVGETLEYSLQRWPGSDPTAMQAVLSDSVVVPEGGMTVRLGYVYPSAGPAAALPNTATSAP